MHSRYALVLLLALSPTMAAAQSAVGFRGGLRMADVESPAATGEVRHYVVGGYFGVGLSDRLALQLELIYGRRGAAGVPMGDGALDDARPGVELSMQYVEAPLLLRTGFPMERVLPSLFLGPYAGFLLGCEMTRDGESWSCRDEDRDQRFHPRATDYGLMAGGGLDLAMGESTIFVDIRYSRSLMDIQGGSTPLDARHAGFEITAGFAFALGR